MSCCKCWKSIKRISPSATEECCICITKSAEYNTCKHCTNTNVCLLCYNDIKNTDNYRCPVCRAENWVKGESDIESQIPEQMLQQINNIRLERNISMPELYNILNFYNRPNRCLSFQFHKTMIAIRNLILNIIMLFIIVLMFGLFSYIFDITIKIGGLLSSIILTGYIYLCVTFCCCGACVTDVSFVKDMFLPVKC